ncbi:hypothetical protein, partial [Mesomycoplasma hyopneumoniae]|uniref:hypothetical protein n=1 Tax=Mesomycoplasma hyopneumoniae TaxID=2099 RepID=UPI002093CF0C
KKLKKARETGHFFKIISSNWETRVYDISYLFRFFKNRMPKINKDSGIKIIDKKLIVWIFSTNLDFHKDIF